MAARRSASAVISSTAMTWGFMARRAMGMPRALGQASSTSVRGPTSIWGLPRYHHCHLSPLIDKGDPQTRPWPVPPEERHRTKSRSSVVLPPPGGDSSRVF